MEDPFARTLFEGARVELPMRLDWPTPSDSITAAEALHLHGSRYIGLRTRFYDDALLAAAEAGLTQAVLLGAGLDTRAFRLDLAPEFHAFELDQEALLHYKTATLAQCGAHPRCRRSTIGIDLRDDWPAGLRQTDFDPQQATIWIAEGLLPYLPPSAQSELIEAIESLSATGSVLALDRITGDPTSAGRLRDLTERSGLDMESLFEGGDSSDLAAVLEAEGWKTLEESTTTVARRYGRDLGNPFSATGVASPAGEPPWLDTLFLTATRAR